MVLQIQPTSNACATAFAMHKQIRPIVKCLLLCLISGRGLRSSFCVGLCSCKRLAASKPRLALSCRSETSQEWRPVNFKRFFATAKECDLWPKLMASPHSSCGRSCSCKAWCCQSTWPSLAGARFRSTLPCHLSEFQPAGPRMLSKHAWRYATSMAGGSAWVCSTQTKCLGSVGTMRMSTCVSGFASDKEYVS